MTTGKTTFNRRQFIIGSSCLASAAMLPWSMSAAAADAVSSTPANGTPRRGGVLRFSVDQGANVIHPHRVRVNPEYLLAELLYSGLTRLTQNMQAEGDLAESWQSNPELTQWTFKLRDNLKFHDGSACTAQDVVASFNAILNPDNASPALHNVGPIDSVTASDDHTVIITTTGAYADLPVALAYPDAKIIPAAIAQGDLERLSKEAIGTGPFKLLSFEPARLIVVERNPDYYDPARPYLDRIEIVVYPDPIAESSALRSGDIDLMMATQTTEFTRLSRTPGIIPLRIASGQFLNVNMGCDQKPFNDVRVRQALALCVDRQAMVDFVAEGYGAPGNDNPLSPAYPFYKAIPLKQADYAKAKALLTEAGYPNGLDLTLIASDRPATRTQLGIALREMCKPAGIRIEVKTMANSTYLDQVWKKNNFYVGFYNMQPTPDAVFSLLYTSEAAWNETRWNNQEFDQQIKQARETADPAQRGAFYARAQELMNEQVPSLIPTFFDLLSASRDYVAGYQLNPRGAVFRLDHVWLTANAPARR
ncbi:ABC transporter substrate-binding protein [Brenneria goodwinii]|uniref:ABC transporter substrate-binding protein n=1 Tax=Brenneria goodwinii TaxID=1109412 RepID=UPI000EF250E9|nr:ABC transporter substrate-binding protein [Brenneria goodwinii]MCG8157934.1 ABC transporter substrate-binding protein [Brenneria goodwinii]MCG8162526.1 ABC transporter substrate-binding protein [Brenneria goodwinii]MCG8166567.1 ABC transporter substrate-binding protein [Brenneria goodwinii]MCG8172488.1 ABC transporter substrate-binding protein [Brenneria goodwinii]MCG8175673.1 ABC transporter substrate-binding protein [Brenneria goodwinii]